MNESAGTEMGPMEYGGARFFHPDHWSKAGFTLYAISVPNSRGEKWEAIFTKTEELAHQVIQAAASHDRLADALRDYRNTFLRLGMYGVANEINGLLTDIPDCPHAQRAPEMEHVVRGYRAEHQERNGRDHTCVTCQMADAALTASTGEA